MSYLKISGGTVYDPKNEVNGEVCDIWVREGKIVAVPLDKKSDRQNVGRDRDGHHAGCDRHALPYCGSQSQHRPQNTT